MQNTNLTEEVLIRMNAKSGGLDIISELLEFIKGFLGIEAVAVRLKEGEDYPYFSTNGLPRSFVLAENSLCHKTPYGIERDEDGNPILACMCGNIICSRTDPTYTFFSEGGSFWTNGTTELLASTSEEDLQVSTRNTCNSAGYESVALIPIRVDNEIIGLLQLNDHEKNKFTLEIIEILEDVCSTIGVAIVRCKSEELVREQVILQSAIEMAGGVCHEFNQPLQVIMGYTEMLLDEESIDPTFKKHLHEILQSSQKMSGLTRKLQKITQYRTKSYVGTTHIADFEQAVAV